MVSIKSGNTEAKFNEFGAELKSLNYNGTEYIWKGDEKIWAPSCPIMFPICSGVINDTYTLGGKEYHLTKHGFAKLNIFDVESKSDDSVTFVLRDNEKTYEQYPYHFEFRVSYKITDKKLTVSYAVKNINDGDMYFSFGAHEGYACPEGIEEYDVIIPNKETLISTTLTGPNTLGYEEKTIIENDNTIHLNYDYFAVDALVFLNMKSKSATLRNRKTGRAIKVTFEGFPYFLLWTKPGAPYICMEPWCGIADRDDCDGIFETKQGINKVSAGQTFERIHTLEIQ